MNSSSSDLNWFEDSTSRLKEVLLEVTTRRVLLAAGTGDASGATGSASGSAGRSRRTRWSTSCRAWILDFRPSRH